MGQGTDGVADVQERELSDDDMPALFKAADSESIRSQAWLKRLTGFILGTSVVSAFLASLRIDPSHLPTFAGWKLDSGTALLITTVLLTLGLFATWVIRSNKYDKIWYDGRAVAESVKTLTWKYICCASPYEGEHSAETVDKKFTDDLLALLHSIKGYSLTQTGPQITAKMRMLRGLTFLQRRDVYLTFRINNQAEWYTSKSQRSGRSYNRWFVAMALSQAGAIVYSAILIANPQIHFNFVPFLTTVASSLLSWTQLNKFQELAESYSIAAQELNIIQERARHVDSEEKLSKFIDDSETAISREHTMWVARRK